MGVAISEMLDLVALTTKNLPLNNIVWTLPFQNYEILNQWFGKDKIELEGGHSIKRHVVLDESGTAKHIQSFERRSVDVTQVISEIEVGWVMAENFWVLTLDEDQLNRSGQSAKSFSKALAKLSDVRRKAALLDMAKLIANKAFEVPATDSGNVTPLGIPYAIPKLAAGQAVTAAGFYGGMYSAAFTTVYGVAPATTGSNTTAITGGKARWRSYCAGYTTINATFIDTMELALMMINFEAPLLRGNKVVDDEVAKYRYYANAATIVAFSAHARANNDRLGSDVGRYAGRTTFKGVPWIHVPQLDNTGSGEPGQYNPVYLVNHNHWKAFVHEAVNFTENGPFVETETPRMATTFMNLRYAYFCDNRQRQACINQIA